MMIQLLCVLLVISLLIWYLHYLYCFTYWKKKGVPTYAPHFPAGNILLPILGKANLFTTIEEFYKEFKSKGHKHAGLYFMNGPVYLAIDPEIVKFILTTDFEHFVDRGLFLNEEKFLLSGHLLSLCGSKWKNLRSKLTSTFSSGKLKAMYEIFMKMTENLIVSVEPTASETGEINIKDVAANFTADVICSTTFGVESNTLMEPTNEFAQIVYRVFNPNLWLYFQMVLFEGFKNPGNIFKAFHSDKIVENFFIKFVKQAIKFHEDPELSRKDLMSSLLEIRDKMGLSFNEILAQCFLFFLAGFETSSQTISYCIHELAHNQDLQNKLRDEIFENLSPDFKKYTFDGINKMPYLDKVVKETLRLYPVLGVLNRICVKTYKVPGTDVIIEKGTPILISTLGLQRDPEYFPESLEFDPERFDEEKSLVPFTYLPFGEGPRFCVGMRFGKLQTKLAIAALISRFKFLPSQKTPKYIEFDRLAKSPVMSTRQGVTVKVMNL